MAKAITNPSALRIFAARPGDAPAIRKLVRAAYAKYVPAMGREPTVMLADYDRAVREHETWLLRDSDELVAVLELIAEQSHMVLENLAVREDRQGRGLGRRLLRLAEGAARREKLSELRLYTNATMTANIALYTRRGYQETRREAFKGSDIVHMAKRL